VCEEQQAEIEELEVMPDHVQRFGERRFPIRHSSTDEVGQGPTLSSLVSGVWVLSGIGSGLNTARKRLQQLLKLVCDDRVGEVAITYPDRLTRFGTLYLEMLFTSFDVAFTVLDPTEEKTPEQELVEDLLSIIASFAGKLYGMRSHKQKELLECAENVLHSP